MKSQRGVGLIEIMITLVVISAGLLAYVGMQRGIYREANLSTGRVVATELAMAKLEDLRGFTSLYTSGSEFAFQDIAANAGGAKSGGSLILPSGNVTVDNLTLNRTWSVNNYWYTAGNSVAQTSTPSGSPIPSFKIVEVVITWTEQSGASQPSSGTSNQELHLSTIIAGIEPKLVGTIFR